VTHPERVLQGLGRALQEARDKRGLTQEALSLETGVHRNYIGGMERGERSPSVEVVVKLADALGVTLAELFKRAERIAAGLA
jgi:transcriptional regulator with XRE-family HTH domain